MPDIAKAIREEISRIAHKEIRAATGQLHRDNVALKRTVRELTRRAAALESGTRRLRKLAATTQAKEAAVTPDEVGSARITAKMIRALRARLGVSQVQFAKLAGVSPMAVYQWEHKKGQLSFRGGSKQKILRVRKLGKREAQERLGKAPAPKKKTAKKKAARRK